MPKIIDYYNNLANNYDNDRFNNSYGKFIDKQERKILDKILSFASNTNVLDMACGTGRLLNYATCGLDSSEAMVALATSKYPNKKILLSDACYTGLADNSFDVIISFHFFMHLDNAAMQQVLLEANRILKKGGSIIFDIPSAKRRRLTNHIVEDWHAASSYTKKNLLKDCGDLFELKEYYGLMFFPLHRIPKGLRNLMVGFDYFLANTFFKNYSSYLVFNLEKK
jgi:ubiquinone/menaquinone biosynthesis C-methylase UbiE